MYSVSTICLTYSKLYAILFIIPQMLFQQKYAIAAICFRIMYLLLQMALKIKFRYTVPTHLSKENMSLYMKEDQDFVSRKMTICENMQELPSHILHNVIEPYYTFRHILQITSTNSS